MEEGKNIKVKVTKDLIFGVGIGFREGKVRDFDVVSVRPTKVEYSAIQCVVGWQGVLARIVVCVGFNEVEHVER